MSVAKVAEISSASTHNFEDAIRQEIERANETLKNITGAWVNEMKIDVTDGQLTKFRVNMKVTFILED